MGACHTPRACVGALFGVALILGRVQDPGGRGMALAASSWPADTSEAVLESTVGGVLRAAAALAPEGPALTAGAADPSARRQWTYAELLDEAERAARSLVARFEPGEHVAIWAHNIPEWVILEYALGLAGLVLVTINPALRPDEVGYVLAQSKAAGVFHVDTFHDQSLARAVEALASKLPDLRNIVSFSDWDEFLAAGDPDAVLPDVSPDDPAQIQYTSGTTGFPKGARLHHRGITNNARCFTNIYSKGAQCVLTPMPLYHTGGCCGRSDGHAADGARGVRARRSDHPAVARAAVSPRPEGLLPEEGVDPAPAGPA